jgi:protein ImuA
VPTGYSALNHELPGGGWPSSTFIEILPPEPGAGEISLLTPALKHAINNTARRIILLNCPLTPNTLCWLNWQLNPNKLVWVHPHQSGQVLWAAEQILRHDACAALLLWLPSHVSLAAARKLHLAAQRSTALFFGLNSTQHHQISSPAPLRLSLKGAPGGIHINIIKRQGPTHAGPLFLPLPIKNKAPFTLQQKTPCQTQVSNHVVLDQPSYTA